MVQLNLIDQIKILFGILRNQTYLLHVIIISVISILFLILINKIKNKKITKIIFITIYTVLVGFLIYMYNNEILKLFDYLIENIIRFLFFPNLAVYILVLVIINIVTVKSILSIKNSRVSKSFNIIFFTIFNIIFYLLLNNIINNNINVYNHLDPYTNQELLVLIELTMIIFVLWMITLLLIKIVNKLINLVYIRKNCVVVLNDEKEVLRSDLTNIDYFPIKKKKENINNIIENNKEFNLQENIIEIIPEVNKIEQDNQSIVYDSSKVNTDLVTLSSYESIFEEVNMDKVFNYKNNYLKNIDDSISNLKNNINDKNSIQRIYDTINDYSEYLNSNDYDYLIKSLSQVKK